MANPSRFLDYKVQMSKTYYDVLGVPSTASFQEIRYAYKKLAAKYHPDRADPALGDTTERMIEINLAYETLSNDILRRAYDLSLKEESVRSRTEERASNNADSSRHCSSDKDTKQERTNQSQEHVHQNTKVHKSHTVNKVYRINWTLLFEILIIIFVLVSFIGLGIVGYQNQKNVQSIPEHAKSQITSDDNEIPLVPTQQPIESFREVPF